MSYGLNLDDALGNGMTLYQGLASSNCCFSTIISSLSHLQAHGVFVSQAVQVNR